MREIRAGLLGTGVVGSSLLRLFKEKSSEILERYGVKLKLVFVCNSSDGVYDPGGLDVEEILRALKRGDLRGYRGGKHGLSGKDISSLDLDLIFEATPTNLENGEPGMTHFIEALSSGVHVITSNKGPLALKYNYLMELAEKNGAHLLFESTVMSGTPVISAIRSIPGKFRKLRGILNGTTNFILTEVERGKSFEEAISEAISLGYAERNPEGDVKGYDAGAKVVILANLAFGLSKTFHDVKISGIEGLSEEEVRRVKEEGKKIRLVAEASQEILRVSPKILGPEDPLFQISGVRNCVVFWHEILGEFSISGPGAGGKETALGMLSDLNFLLSSIVPRCK